MVNRRLVALRRALRKTTKTNTVSSPAVDRVVIDLTEGETRDEWARRVMRILLGPNPVVSEQLRPKRLPDTKYSLNLDEARHIWHELRLMRRYPAPW